MKGATVRGRRIIVCGYFSNSTFISQAVTVGNKYYTLPDNPEKYSFV